MFTINVPEDISIVTLSYEVINGDTTYNDSFIVSENSKFYTFNIPTLMQLREFNLITGNITETSTSSLQQVPLMKTPLNSLMYVQSDYYTVNMTIVGSTYQFDTTTSGKLNIYEIHGIPNFSGGDKVLSDANQIPASLFSSRDTDKDTEITQANPSNSNSNYFTNLIDGYIMYNTDTTKHFGIKSDDYTILWIIQGVTNWDTIISLMVESEGDGVDVDYTWIENNISNATIVCGDPGIHGSGGNYEVRTWETTEGDVVMNNWGSYTFKANTVYSILILFGENKGNQSIYFGISDTSLKTK